MSRPYICYNDCCEYNLHFITGKYNCFLIGGCQYRIKEDELIHQHEDKGE